MCSALFAVFLLYSYTQEKSESLTKKFGAKQRVVVAVRDINEMETIDETMLDITEQPVDSIQPTALNDPELAVGKVALAPIIKGEQILESKILMDVLRERNLVDGLTGLYNRKYLDEFIEKKMPQELLLGSTYAVMFLDIDYFKMVNDTYGHDAGDAILQKLSKTMKAEISDKDFIIRFGGEEFLIIMENPTEESAKDLATRINSEFAKLVYTFNNESFSKTVSIGYAFLPSDTDQMWKCIKFADLCLYKAKETGRNKVIRFTKDLLTNKDKDNY